MLVDKNIPSPKVPAITFELLIARAFMLGDVKPTLISLQLIPLLVERKTPDTQFIELASVNQVKIFKSITFAKN